jgi:hypothetical protein
VKWLAWVTDDGDRTGAMPITIALDASDAAVIRAERAYLEEPFDKYIDITVIAIASDGTETTHEFTVDVEHEPAFTARSRT